MALDFFHLAWLVATLPLLVAAGLVTAGLAWLFSVGVEGDRRVPLIVRLACLPAVTLFALYVCLLTQDMIDRKVFHRLTTVSPLAGDYVLEIRGDQGAIAVSRGYRPAHGSVQDRGEDEGPWMWINPADGDDALRHVTLVRVMGPVIAGAYRHNGSDPEHYFLLDTRSDALALFPDAAAFVAAAARQRIEPVLEAVPAALAEHRA